MDACDAPRSARHYALTQDARERACDRRADASSNEQARANARLAFVAHHREPVAAFDMRNPDQPARLCVEASCVARRRVRSPLRRSTWDFWPGPVLAVVPAFAEASAGKPARAQSSGMGTARLGPLAKASRGSLGSPSGIVRLSSHGSSLPGGAGLAGLPGTVASRIRRRHGLAPPCKDAPRRRPSGTRMTLCSMSPFRGQ